VDAHSHQIPEYFPASATFFCVRDAFFPGRLGWWPEIRRWWSGRISKDRFRADGAVRPGTRTTPGKPRPACCLQSSSFSRVRLRWSSIKGISGERDTEVPLRRQVAENRDTEVAPCFRAG